MALASRIDGGNAISGKDDRETHAMDDEAHLAAPWSTNFSDDWKGDQDIISFFIPIQTNPKLLLSN
jgi:hypothetical protein